MKLLLDANLSPKLAARLAGLFRETTHVFETGLARFTPDVRIWEHARDNGFTILTADRDFVELSREHGGRPQIILIDRCDFRSVEIENLIRQNMMRIAEFERSTRSLLVLKRSR
ncbi:MAG: DUF5615 family PIN-like protein [Bryobacteraceae bacterium]